MQKTDLDSTGEPDAAPTLKAKVSNDNFVKLVTDNYGMYINKCHSYLKCPKLAEDAVQDGILAAHLNLEKVKDPSALGAWLYRVIIRKAIDLLHQSQKFPSFDGDLEELVSYNKHGFLNAPIWAQTSNPEEEILRTEGLLQVKEAINALADIYRIPVMLKDFEGFSIMEISEMLEISQSNVKVRIHRGRIKLRSELSDYFFPNYTGDHK